MTKGKLMRYLRPQHLMLPGPTPLPPAVLQAMASPMINHRSEAFTDLYKEVEAGVRWICQTRHEVVMLAGSGTTGMEATICNLFSPGERVLAITQGSFSERFAQIARTFGLETDVLAYEWGEAARPEDLETRLERAAYKAVLLVHNETSTGVLNPLKELARVIRRHGALSIVDAISSLSTTPLPVDAWHLDVALTASQKGYYAPPGLAMATLSAEAWKACEKASLPRFTTDFRLIKEYAARGQTPWTPPLPVYYALKAGFEQLQHEGLPNLHARHYLMMRAVRAGLRALGLRLMIEDEAIASRAVTPVYPPEGIAADELRKLMFNNYHVSLGAGLRKQSGQLFRVGHLGYQDLPGVLGVLDCIELTLRELGHRARPGAAAAAALEAARGE